MWSSVFLLTLLPIFVRGGPTCQTSVQNPLDIANAIAREQPLVGAFGEQMNTIVKPFVQVTNRGTLNTVALEVFELNADAGIDPADGSMFCLSGGAAGSYSVIRTRDAAPYRPGNTLLARFDGRFQTNVTTDHFQFAGLFTNTDFLMIGLRGAAETIRWSYNGRMNIIYFDIDSGETGGGSIDVNFPEFTSPLTVTLSPTTSPIAPLANARDIANQLEAYGEFDAAYYVMQEGARVTCLPRFVGPKDMGQVSMTTTGSFTNTIRFQEGRLRTDVFIDRDEWNGEDNSWLDMSKYNQYQIVYGGSGATPVKFFAYPNTTDRPILLHTIRSTNTLDTRSIYNPAWRLGFFTFNPMEDPQMNNVTVRSSSWALSNIGEVATTRRTFGWDNVVVSDVSDGEIPVMSFRVRDVFQGLSAVGFVQFLTLSAGSESQKGTIIRIRYNPTTLNVPLWRFVDETESAMLYDTDATEVAGGILLGSFSVGFRASFILNFNDLAELRFHGTATLLPFQRSK